MGERERRDEEEEREGEERKIAPELIRKIERGEGDKNNISLKGNINKQKDKARGR